MRILRASGDRSFEELIARLLSKLSGERIRRCTAGSQGGVDALAEIPFAIEDKRYAQAVRSRDLEGGLTSAAGTHPELQLWVLVATCAVGAQAREAVRSAGRRQGVGVLVLDATSAEPDLPAITTLAALAATDVETTLEAFADPTWRVGHDAPNLHAIRRELTAIRELQNYAAWEARLRHELRDLPTWRHLVRLQNEWLRSHVLGDALNAFGTPYDPAEAVPRSVEADLTAWWKTCATAAMCEVAVVTGDRYDGKTWLVYRWLSAALADFRVPVFLFSSAQVKAAHGDLETLILRQCERALGSFARHARDVLLRHRSRRAGAGPWCLVILDGVNEYAAAPEARAAAIVWAVPPAMKAFVESDDVIIGNYYPEVREDDPVDDSRRCGLLVTCRARDFDMDASWLGTRPVRRIELGAYDADEFRIALDRRPVSSEQLIDLPRSALEMVHRPRYFDLMLHHETDIARFGAVTVDVLHYLDASDKVSSREATVVRQDPIAFKEFLARLADRWIQGRRLTHTDVWADLRSVTDRVEQSLRALTSEGVLTPRADGTFVPDPDLLALGMGLFLRNQLLAVTDAVQLDQTLADLLEPHADDDEKVRWLRAAVTVSVLAGDIAEHAHVVQELLGTWLASRNFSQADLDDLRVLGPQLLPPVLDLLADANARAEIVFLFAEPIIAAGIAANEPAVARIVRHWCRLAPVGFPRYIGDVEGENSEVAATRIADPSLADLGLTLPGNMSARTIRACQRVALFLATTRPSLLRPEDVLALFAVRNATTDYLGQGEQYAIRIILRDSDATWFLNEVSSWTSQSTATRTILLRELILATDRADLRKLLALLPDPTDYRRRDALTRSQLATLAPTHDEKEMLQLAGRARLFALDPTTPPPSRRWRDALGTAAIARFAGSATLQAFNCTSRDDLDLAEVEPALAAWASAGGAQIWRQFIADIPRRLEAKEESCSWTIEGHAALLAPPDRRKLLKLIRMAPYDDADRRHALERVYCCVIAGAPPAQRIRLLLDHPFDQEWTTLYEVAAAPNDEVLRQRALATVRRECDPRRLRRARLLLGYLRPDLTPEDVARLGDAISKPDTRSENAHAADFLLRKARVEDSTPSAAFGPLAVVAVSAGEAAWQYSAFIDRERHRGELTGLGLARALVAPETARRRGARSDVPDDVAVAEGIVRLAEEVRGSLAHSLENPTFGEGEQFPDTIADAISDASFDEWVRLLLALPQHAHRAHIGILMAIIPRALRTRHVAARELWTLVYPFQRTPMAFGTRFTVKGGIDWTLRLIHDQTLDDALATELLRDLIADCRSDSELVSVALGARLQSTARLASVVADGLGGIDPATRARARFISGWMPENSGLRRHLATPDPSRWVERMGTRALDRLDRERWARDWLRRFLSEHSRVSRWAAGRLFLECTDAATPFWFDDVLYGERELTYPTRRAEGELLLWRVRAKPNDSEFRENFLGYRVRDLADLVAPWRQPKEWRDVQEQRHK